MTFRVLDLFSGVGGFAIATHLLGMETAAFVEWDAKCQTILALRFPGVPIHGDITTLTDVDLAAIGPVELVVGGFPCPPVSVAGRRRGAADDRWLWPEMARVIGIARPSHCLVENVGGLVSLGLATVLVDLEGLGYHVRHVEVPACATEADHERQRVWILAVRHADAAIGGLRRGTAPGQTGQPARDGQSAATGGCSDTEGVAEREPDDAADPIATGRDTRVVVGGVGSTGAETGADADGQRWTAGSERRIAAEAGLPDGDGALPIGRTPHGDPVCYEILRPIAIAEGLVTE